MRRQLIRLLRYSIFGQDMLPISQEESLHPRGYHHDPRTGPDPYIQRTYSSHLQDDKLSDYSSTRPTDRTCSLSRKKISTSMRQQLVDYSENIRLLRYSKKQIKTANIKATSRSAVNLKECTIDQNVKSTPIATPIHKNQEDITTNCLSLWCRHETTDNLISDGFHLRNILRESLL